MRILLVLLVIFCSSYCFSQQKKKDSLWSQVNETSSDTTKVNSLNKLFIIYSTQNSDSAHKIAEQALELSKKIKYDLGKATAYNNLGTAFYYKGNNSKSLSNFLAAVNILESQKGAILKNSDYLKQLSTSYNNIGTIYQRQKLYDKAEMFFRKSIEIDRISGDKKGMAHCYNNIGTIHEETNNYEEAIKNYELALQLKIEIKDTVGIPSTLINIGVLQMNQKKYREAKSYFEKALRLAIRSKNKQDEALAQINLGDLYYLQDAFAVSIPYYERGIEICKKQQYDQFLIYAHNSLSLAYYAMKDFEKAYDQFQLYVNVKDSLYNSENSKYLHEMESKYENEVKEKEIKLLTAEKAFQDLEIDSKKTLIYGFVGGFILLILLIGMLLYAYFSKRRINSELDTKNQKIELAYTIIEQKQTEIVDSINYAKRIQYTLLAHEDYLTKNLNEHFVLYKPKDIVSGDFYWASKQGNKFFLAICDSTGHGVPGAFMSLLNIGFLSEAINEKGIYKPNDVLNYVRKRVIEAISHEGQQDGFDGVLVCIDNDEGLISYASAHNNPVLIENNTLHILPKDKMPVGIGEIKEDFKLYTVNAQKGSILYLMTDGYADQFGGPIGKKYMFKQLKNTLLAISNLPISKQKEILNERFEEWRGELEQVDDVCIVGLRI